MGFHHVALATGNLAATHHFYTDAMGFDLVKAVMAPTPQGGWAKHVFYDTGGNGLIAFWDLHIPAVPPVRGAMSGDVGLPDWVNHLAFDAADLDQLAQAQARWESFGLEIIDIDHGFCRSIYTVDPSGTLVEWCMDLRPLSAEERERAAEVISMDTPDRYDPEPVVSFVAAVPELTPSWGSVPASS